MRSRSCVVQRSRGVDGEEEEGSDVVGGGGGAGEVRTIAMAHYGVIHLIGQIPDVVPSHV